ncbi:MAG: hypothetical protein WA154_02565 [Moraxellaceae bacterium]
MKWSENLIAATLAMQFLNRMHLVVVPNTKWTGYECDLLCVTKDLRIIDFEIKISRSDFYADAKKLKWWNGREHPEKCWKHYYVMPAEIWDDSMAERLPSPSCGVLLLSFDHKNRPKVFCAKRAKPNKFATRVSTEQVLDIARLATLRMWSMIERGVAV